MLVLSALEAGGAPVSAVGSLAVRVEGRILDGSGDPLAGVTVAIAPGGEGAPQTAQTGDRGRFAFDVTPGAYRFTLSGVGQPGRIAAPRFEIESGLFMVETDADLTIALPFQPVTVRVQEQHGLGLSGFTISPAMTDGASPFITAGIDWTSRSAYDEAALRPVTDEAGEALLFLFPTTYDVTAQPPEGMNLDAQTHSGVSVYGAVTETFAFHVPERLDLPEDFEVPEHAGVPAPRNTPPLADAGKNRKIRVGKTVSLNGSRSSDLDGDALSYHWRLTLPKPATTAAEIVDWVIALPKPVSAAAELIDAETVKPSFVAHAPGAYAVELVVNDGIDDSAPALVIMTVRPRKEYTFLTRVGRTERSAHSWLKTQRWPQYLGIGAMAVGQVIYVRAQYSNNSQLNHPAQSLFDFGFNLSAYVMIDRFTDFAGVSMLQNWTLQAVINTTFDYPIVWPDEPSHYDLFGVDVPKAFHGELRWIQLGTGVALIVVPRIIRKLRRDR